MKIIGSQLSAIPVGHYIVFIGSGHFRINKILEHNDNSTNCLELKVQERISHSLYPDGNKRTLSHGKNYVPNIDFIGSFSDPELLDKLNNVQDIKEYFPEEFI